MNLISVSEKVALVQLPKKKKQNSSDLKHCPAISVARENSKLASSRYNATPAGRRKTELHSAKTKLDETYLDTEAFINDKIN